MISVTLLTQDSAKYLREVLGALQLFDEVVVLDSGSKDSTLEIAKEFPNVTIHTHTFDGFGPAHNRATALAKNDWILSVDSDEVITPELIDEIQGLALDSNAVYGIPRKNFYNGKFIRRCGWYPNTQWRLYNRTSTRFTDAQVHEGVIREGMVSVKLKHPMLHYSYSSTADFLHKMQSYSTLFAEQHKGKKRSSTCKAALHCLYAFLKTYILKWGFLDGKEGFLISVYNANTAFYKYLKLAELNGL